jgi:hypothetical protein
MARTRNLKPQFFTDAELLECPFWVRLLFQGLWVHADCRGILADSVKQIKISVFPADSVDVEAGLTELAERGFIVRYSAAGQRCIAIPAFARHQSPHPKEPESLLPAPPDSGESLASNLQATDSSQPRKRRASEVAEKESKQKESKQTETGGVPRGVEPDTPYALLHALCQATDRDIGLLTTREKNGQLAIAKRLIADEITAGDVRGFVAYLHTQDWRSEPVTMWTVEKGIGTWRASGRPAKATAPARASPRNNGGGDVDYLASVARGEA